MAQEADRVPAKIACLQTKNMPFTLVSIAGFHCDVWRSIGVIVRGGERAAMDFVLKRYKRPCSLAEIRVLGNEYRILKVALEEIVPTARFVATRVDEKPSVIVMAENCTPWFDLSNPGNEDEALPLLSRRPRARAQLAEFVRHARRWMDEESKIIDLGGTENLVLDKDYGVRYLDSFHVFFYLDMLHVIEEVDDSLTFRIEMCIRRLEYLERLVRRLQ
jgi:hypothetical protein